MDLMLQHLALSVQESRMMDTLTLLLKTVLFRPYVFVFVATCLVLSTHLIGWRRTGLFFGITWITAFLSEFSSTRTGFPFGWYHYTASTVGQELYVSNIPFMDSLSFTFLLYATYCLALSFLLPTNTEGSSNDASSGDRELLGLTLNRSIRTSWPAILLSTLFFVFLDMVIDPVALRGDRWFLGKIYYYPDPGLHFGVPVVNYAGWAVVGMSALGIYAHVDRRLPGLEQREHESVTNQILMGCSLYYGVLLFNLTMTFWIDEPLLGMNGILLYIPLTVLLLLRLLGKLPASAEKDGAIRPRSSAGEMALSRVIR